MRLTELNPHFLKRAPEMKELDIIVGDHETWRERGCPTEKVTRLVEIHQYVDAIADADGIQFNCPKCNGHKVCCWFRGRVPDDVDPKPGRWTPQCTGYDDLTFVPGEPAMAVSVLLSGPGCGAHFFISNGEVT